jgi:putative nucleotidyltransferase with HDIG domain
MRMIAKAIDERTTYLRGHSERVASYSADIARELGIDADQVERIRLAALLHDIGTVGIEDSIVRKEAPLTPEEFEIVKAHTVKGASILRPIQAIGDLIPGVELHHESLDGQGYPYGLRGEEIPMMARIIAVADSFDAMTTTRPYQAAMDPEYVLEVLNRLASKRYDASAVNALTSLVKRGNIVVKNPRTPVSFSQQRALSEVI